MELAQIEVFLALAEELHFGRTAERLYLTPPRVSRLLASLEREVGGALFNRTSRRIQLTPLGVQLRDALLPAHAQLQAALAQARTTARANAGPLRIGFLLPTGGQALNRLVGAFETRYPTCPVVLKEVDPNNIYAPLRRDEINVLISWLAVDEPDLTTGPAIDQAQRVLMAAATDPLAKRSSVSIEDLADRQLFSRPPEMPNAIFDRMVPPATPSGKPLRRSYTMAEVKYGGLAAAVARGHVVHPTVAAFAALVAHRHDLVFIPIRDLPPLPFGLIWVTAHENARIRALAETATDLLPSGPTPQGLSSDEPRPSAGVPGPRGGTAFRAHRRTALRHPAQGEPGGGDT